MKLAEASPNGPITKILDPWLYINHNVEGYFLKNDINDDERLLPR